MKNSTIHHNDNKNRTTAHSGRRIAKAAIVLAALIGAGSTTFSATAFAAESSIVTTDGSDDVISAEEYEAIMTRIRGGVNDDETANLFTATATGWTDLGMSLGKSVADKVFGKAFGFAFDSIMTELGMDATAQALQDIQDSIDAVATDVRTNTDLLVQLMSEAKRTQFNLFEVGAQDMVSDLVDVTDQIIRIEQQGGVPSATEVDDVYRASRYIAYHLGTKLVGSNAPTGITGGTVWLMQEAMVGSDHEEAWSWISAYRDYYRAQLAQALINVDWAEGHDDIATVEVARNRPDVEQKARAVVDALYDDVGVAYPEPVRFSTDGAPTTVGTSIHLGRTRAGTIYARDDRPLLPGEERDAMRTGDNARTMYNQLKQEFDAGVAGGRTFVQYLDDEKFPTSVHHANTFEKNIKKGMTNEGMRWCGWVGYDLTRVSGNNIVDDHMGRGQDEEYCSYYDIYYAGDKARAKANVERQVDQRYAELYDAAQNHSPYRITTDVNPAGLAVSPDGHAVAMAKHGLRIQLDEGTGSADDLGALTIENLGGYDTAFFIDAETGNLLGSVDLTSGTLDGVEFAAPASGWVEIVIGDSVAGYESTMAPAGSTAVPTSGVTPGAKGVVRFSTVTAVGSLA